MNVLITSASRKVSLVRAFQEALARDGGGTVIAADAGATAAALYHADHGVCLPASADAAFAEQLRAVCERYDIGLIIPTRDAELPWLASHADELRAADIEVMIAPPATVELCQDKKLFGEFCRRNGFLTPRAWQRPIRPETLAYPVFVKPRRGRGGVGSRRIESADELRTALACDAELIVQECVDAPEFTIDLFADFDGRVVSAVPRLRERTFGGESFVSRTVRNPRLMTQAIELATALGLVGHNTIQCFLHCDQVLFIEVNPRYGGGAALGFAAGAPTPEWLVRLVNGQPVGARLGQYQADLVMLRHTEDVFLPADRLLSANAEAASEPVVAPQSGSIAPVMLSAPVGE